MKQKTKIRILVIKTIGFIVLLCLLLYGANKVLMMKDGINKYQRFYEEKTSFDILFFGSSRVLDAFQPMELWDGYGIRSYNMAQHSESLAVNYWQIKNALKYNKPKLMVVDVSVFFGNGVSIDNEESRAYLHKQIDHMSLSATKLQAIKELVPSELYPEYVFPFILYHSRWNQVTLSDFQTGRDNRMGSEVRTNIMPQERILWTDETLSEVFLPENINLDKLVALCKEEQVPTLFICMPCNENAAVVSSLNHFAVYLDENGMDYINISKDEDFLNYATDFSDTSHVNAAGSQKLTRFIGEYFLKNHEITPVDEKTVAKWNEILLSYQNGKDSIICQYKEAPEYLMMLTYCDDDYYVEIEGSEEICIINNVFTYYPDILCDDTADQLKISVYRQNGTTPLVEYTESDPDK